MSHGEWTTVKVSPIFKGNDKSNVSKTRHISILPFFLKVLEKIAFL